MSTTIKKIMIFGRPASGKSTFALQLSRGIKFPLFHLDKFFFHPNWVKKNHDECESILKKFVVQDSWIIDGNDPALLEMRYKNADIILFFDFPKWLCLYRAIKRLFFKDKGLDDRAKGCPEKLSIKFIDYLLNFEKYFNAEITRLQKEYPTKKFLKITDSTSLSEASKFINKNVKPRSIGSVENH